MDNKCFLPADKKRIFLFIFAVYIIIISVSCSILNKEKPTNLSYKHTNLKSLVKHIDAIFNDPMFENAFWGVIIESLDTGKIWYERNPDKLFMPASNQKILTTAAALEELGPDYRFKTTLSYTGKVTTPTLEGNLVVYSNGDPSMYDRLQTEPLETFKKWAKELKEQGISEIKGDIIGDDNAFDDENLGYGWSFNYLDTWYAAEIGPLIFNENIVDITIIPPNYINEKAVIISNINSSYFRIINNLEVIETGKSSISFFRKYGTNDIIVEGKVVVGDSPLKRSPTITNPTLFYVTVLKELLENEGIKVYGNPVDCDDIPGWISNPQKLNLITIHYSPPLSDLIKQLMKRSQNLYADMFVKALGYNDSGLGTFKNGRNVVQRRLANFGIPPDSYRYSDGSGLTRYNFVSPRLILKILKGMKQSPYWNYWYDSFPIGGSEGTLRGRMKQTSAEGNVHAKTGTLDNVRGLSGYMKTAAGENIVFSFLVNNHIRTTNDTNTITDSVLALIADYGKK